MTQLIPHEDACAEFGVELLRLRGWILLGYGSIRYPIGDEQFIYRDSLMTFLKRRRAADHAPAEQT